MNLFQVSFVALIPITAAIAYLGKPASARQLGYPPEFFKLRLRYLAAWFVCVAVDWLQGPYLYDLYSETHGLETKEIAVLYVVGYAASAVAGPITGVLADRFGRRRCCMAYCICYGVSCALSHCTWYSLLILGRLLGAVAFEILYTAFESWLVHAHRSKELPATTLDNIFALMWFGNFIVAALSGVLAQVLADFIPKAEWEMSGKPILRTGSYTAPFDASLVLCVVGFCLVRLWDDDKSAALVRSDGAGFEEDLSDRSISPLAALSQSTILLGGVIVSGVESTLFLFIFHWTDALKSDEGFTSHGYAFSSFMMCSMIGSTLFSMMKLSAERVLVLSSLIIAMAWIIAVSAGFVLHSKTSWAAVAFRFGAFCIFEMCLGTYFPAMSTVKSMIVPEGVRSFVYTAYRAPMNTIVTIVQLLNLSFELASITSVMLALLACASASILVFRRPDTTDSLLPRTSEIAESFGSQVELGTPSTKT